MTSETDASAAPPPQVAPLWKRVPFLLRLPLARPVLLRMAALVLAAAASPMLAVLFGAPGVLLMLPLLLMVWVAGLQYGLTIIEQGARGFLYPIEYPPALTPPSVLRPLKIVAVYAAFVLLAVLTGLATGSDAAAQAVAVLLFAVAAPAALIRFVVSGSLTHAISPTGIVQTIVRMRWTYAVLGVAVVVVELLRIVGAGWLASLGGAGGLAGGGRSGALAVGAGLFIGFLAAAAVFWYFTYVLCGMIGYAMLQAAGPLNLTVMGPGERRHGGRVGMRRIDMAKRTRDALMNEMVARGELREAIDMVNDDLRERPNDLSLHARLHQILLLEGYAPRIESHADRYLDLLMRSDNARQALPMVEDTLKRSPAWAPRETSHIVPLARAALAAGQPALAARLVRGFDKKHRMHPDTPFVYLIGAQAMLQAGGASPQVEQLLQMLVQKYPQHPAGQEARRTLDQLYTLGTRAASH